MVPPTPTSLLDKCNAISEKRAHRRRIRRTAEIVEIDVTILSASPNELAAKFGHFLHTFDQSKCSSECFQIFLNSLTAVCAKEYPCHSQSDHRVFINNFLKKLLKCFTGVFANDSMNLGFYELLVLLEVHLLRFFPVHLSQTQIVARLRTIYFASDPVAFRHFLDDVLCDEFLDDLPFYLAGIYEQLLLEMPLDLQRFQSQEYRHDISGGQTVFKNRLAERLENFVKALDEEDREVREGRLEEATKERDAMDEEGTEERTRAPRKSRKSIRQSPNDNSLARRRIQVIPETPEKDPQVESKSGENEVIEQTPIGKIHGALKTSHFANLLRKEEEKFSRMRLIPSKLGRAKRALNVGQQTFERAEKGGSAENDGKAKVTPRGAKRAVTPSSSSATLAMLNKRPRLRVNYCVKSPSTSSVLSFPFSRKS